MQTFQNPYFHEIISYSFKLLVPWRGIFARSPHKCQNNSQVPLTEYFSHALLFKLYLRANFLLYEQFFSAVYNQICLNRSVWKMPYAIEGSQCAWVFEESSALDSQDNHCYHLDVSLEEKSSPECKKGKNNSVYQRQS